jgi:hypothetical protein
MVSFLKYAILNLMKIYLDACCLNRLFDDQSQARVHLETEAILLIFERGRGNYTRDRQKWLPKKSVREIGKQIVKERSSKAK